MKVKQGQNESQLDEIFLAGGCLGSPEVSIRHLRHS